MRIRKNAKVSVLTHAYDAGLLAEMPSPHVCELNQSPWDVVVFSPDSPASNSLSGHFQAGDEHDSFYTPDASWFDDSSVAAADESSAVASVKMSVEASGSDDSSEMMRDQCGSGIIVREEEKVVPVKSMRDSIDEAKAKEKEEQGEERLLCNRADGRGWHCWREAVTNHSLCKHHLAQVQVRAPVIRQHNSRPKKPPHPSPVPQSNRNEFYYYSGFGPRWGKRRGGCGMESISADNNDAARAVSGKEEEGAGGSGDEEMEFVDEDYDYDDEEEDDNEGVRKRPRKPVKARSLKSLM